MTDNYPASPDHSMELLYYPNFSLKNLDGIKRSLLLYDRVHIIVPISTPLRMMSVLSDNPVKDLSEVDRYGALGNTLSTYVQARSSPVGVIYDSQVVQNRREEFMNALNEDLNDPEVIAWEKHWKDTHGGLDLAWLVAPNYFVGFHDLEKYRVQPIPFESGTLMRVPFLVGMSLGLSGALWSAFDNGYTLYTDNLASQEFLMLRLKRGWQYLTRDPELQNRLEIEPELAKNFAVAHLGTRTLGLKVPNYFKTIASMPIEDIIKLREESDDRGKALKEFRAGLGNIVKSRDLWEVRSFKDFKSEVYKAVEKDIKPYFEVLAKRNVQSPKDFVAVFDDTDQLRELFKSIPDVFVTAPVVGSLALIGGLAVVPHALLVLGFGLLGISAATLVKQVQNRHEQHKSARFLTYPERVGRSLQQK